MGNFGTEYVRDSWKEPLKKLFSTVWVNAAPLMAHSDYQYTYCQRYIHSLIRDDEFNYFYFYSDGLKDAFPDEFFDSIRAAGLPIITFHADDEPEVWYRRNRPFEHHYDLVATHSKRGWQKRLEEDTGPKPLYLPWAYNPTFYYKKTGQSKEKKYDVVFIGKYKETGVTAIADEDGKQRKDILIKIYDICCKNDLIFKVFGVGWDRHPILASAYGGILDQPGMVEVYNRTKIVFNPGYSADDTNFTGYQTKLRHFEVPGCGAFQLCNINPELAELFEEDKEIVFYGNEEELGKKILFYLNNDKERELIAEAGYKRALSQHTTAHRLQYLFEEAKNLFPRQKARTSPPPPSPKIARVIIGNPFTGNEEKTDGKFSITDLQILAEKADTLAKDYQWLQLVPGQFQEFRFQADYETLRGLLAKHTDIEQIDILSVHSVIKFRVKDSNFIQEDWRNFSGFMLTPDRFIPGYERYMQTFVKEIFRPITTEEGPVFLFNYLIRPAALKRIVDNLSEVTEPPYTPFKGLTLAHSHRIVSEILVKEPKIIQYSQRKMKHEHLFANLAALGKTLMIYGARGYPIPGLMDLIIRYNIKFLGFIDRTLAGQEIQGKPVYSRDKLEELKPDVIIISPETSGPAIFRSLTDWHSLTQIIPLHDIEDPAWDV